MSQSLQCIFCLHYTGLQTCSAFPDEIPFPIYSGEHDHRTEYPGDKGIRYEHDPDAPEDPTLEEDEDSE